jgi:hypothetical protein
MRFGAAGVYSTARAWCGLGRLHRAVCVAAALSLPTVSVPPPVPQVLALTRVSLSATPGFVLLQDVSDVSVRWSRCLSPTVPLQQISVSLPHLAMSLDR